MIQLVYVSIAVIETTAEALAGLVEQARRNNRRDEITGMLAVRSGRFLQVMEGPKDVIEEAFLRMVVDPRHTKMKLLSRRVVTKREFGEWELEHCEDASQIESFIDKVRDLTKYAPDPARASFQDFMSEKGDSDMR